MKALITIMDDDGRVVEKDRLIEPTQHTLQTIAKCIYDEYTFAFKLKVLRSFGEYERK